MSLAMRAHNREQVAPSKTAAPSKASHGLQIGAPGTAFEREADRAAAEIGAPSAPRHHWSRAKINALQSKRVTPQSATAHHAAAPKIVGEVLSSPGRPLDHSTSTYMGERFGHDFSKVKV